MVRKAGQVKEIFEWKTEVKGRVSVGKGRAKESRGLGV